MTPLIFQHIDAIDAAITEIDQEVDANIEPFRTAITILSTIPGVSQLSAEVIAAEIGVDMGRFPTEGHLISWAGLCPKNDESAGKRRCTRMRKGAPWLKTTLIQCAWAATRTKGTYLQAQFHRLRARRGAKKAIGAVAASILTAAYHMLRNGALYQDLGAGHFDRRAKTTQTNRLIAKTPEPRLCRPDHTGRSLNKGLFLVRRNVDRRPARPPMLAVREPQPFEVAPGASPAERRSPEAEPREPGEARRASVAAKRQSVPAPPHQRQNAPAQTDPLPPPQKGTSQLCARGTFQLGCYTSKQILAENRDPCNRAS